ncbi:hypothetical protein SAMN04515679_2118 [Pelosinus fermentans]|uniref:Uncharacterized protein n=1 Tax=Pelosinus fermentans B4 TaxID=1149862 RepID=I8RHA7_9FIRM|nr:hypothetical protein FB4_4611 [Pelosinus fermentans B4]OAM94013.1 hypothetical protein FR7_02030 [Pelosinus fermentans DSM 17108]SDQ97173.1 hypothetical protein SAMN04515679_2118 [Pelosinus fermentans]
MLTVIKKWPDKDIITSLARRKGAVALSEPNKKQKTTTGSSRKSSFVVKSVCANRKFTIKLYIRRKYISTGLAHGHRRYDPGR